MLLGIANLARCSISWCRCLANLITRSQYDWYLAKLQSYKHSSSLSLSFSCTTRGRAAPNVANSFQSGRFWAIPRASVSVRLWPVLSHTTYLSQCEVVAGSEPYHVPQSVWGCGQFWAIPRASVSVLRLWPVLSHTSCLSQCEVVAGSEPYHVAQSVWGCGISSRSVQSWAMWYNDVLAVFFQTSGESAKRIFLVSIISSNKYVLYTQRGRYAWTGQLRWKVINWSSTEHLHWKQTGTTWYRAASAGIFDRERRFSMHPPWCMNSRHSEPYRKIGKLYVLYDLNFNLQWVTINNTSPIAVGRGSYLNSPASSLKTSVILMPSGLVTVTSTPSNGGWIWPSMNIPMRPSKAATTPMHLSENIQLLLKFENTLKALKNLRNHSFVSKNKHNW